MKYKLLVKGLLPLLVLFLSAQLATAQFTASGKVTDAAGEGLAGATIAMAGTSRGTTTDLNGSYRLDLPGSSATLTISYTGYKTVKLEVSSSNATTDVVLEEDFAGLDEVVVSGLATNVKRANLANSVATISARELTGVTNQSTMDGALYGKFRGAEIRSNSGAPGGGMSVRMRGVTSIFGNQQPLYIVDGIFLNNDAITLGTNIVSEAAAGGNAANTQDDASNRIADLDPEDIESIEILKGASAAATYGSRAAGGVVIITTKKGVAGKSKVTLSQTVGVSMPIRLLGMRDWTADLVEQEFGATDRQTFLQNGLTDYEKKLYDNTPISTTTRVDVSGGNDKTTYFIGGTYKNEEGLVNNTGYEKISGRLNIGHRFNDWLDVNVTNNYINSTADRGFFNNSNTNTTIGYAHAFTKPWLKLEPTNGGDYPAINSAGSNILETAALVTNRENINRYIGGATANIRLWNNDHNELKAVVRAGIDQYTLRTTSIFPQNLSYMREPGTLGGVSVSGATVNTNTLLWGFLVYTHVTDGGITLRTQAGMTAENFDQNTVVITATGLNGSQTNVDQSGAVSAFQRRFPQKDRGFFAQQEFNWKDRILVAVGIRGDKSTNNGDANKLYYYPKANLAINLHEFDNLIDPNGAISQAKLRVAYGQSGRFSNFNDRFNPMVGTFIGTSNGLFTDPQRGNTEVGPERQKEIEFGTDLGFFKNRLVFDVTYYIKDIDDLLLRAQVPQSTGYTTQVLNAGGLRNQGIEIGIDAVPVRGRFTWNTGISFWKNTSEITRLDVPAFNLGGFALSLGQYRIEKGLSATTIVGTVPKDDPDFGTATYKVYGNAEPDFNMSFTNSFSVGNWDLTFLVHWRNGGDAINLSTLLWDLGQLTWDYDDKTLDPAGVMGNGPYRVSQWNGNSNSQPWIEDAGYIRLREIGLYYTIPRRVFNDKASVRLGVSGRNLINSFDYNSYDPESSNFGNNVLANAVEVTPFPSAKRINFHLTASF
ncbi:MAG: SusC/RagA family TonB-linked outer membrane protein [Saprospiraceae bacterium]